MATVNWPNSFSNGVDYFGFDFRDILIDDPDVGGLSDPAGIETYELKFLTGPPSYDGLPTTDHYRGSFIVEKDEAGIVVVESGTLMSFTRTSILNRNTVGSIRDFEMDYREAADASLTASKSDDMALWEKAFAGNDSLTGSPVGDRLEGFAGADKLIGRLGGDKLYGGADRDTFVFTSIKDSTVSAAGRDIIYDFSSSQKDKIDLRAIDANTKATGNQAFKYIGTQDFHKKAGELLWDKVKGGVQIQADVNGDGKADFSLTLRGVAKLTTGDFFL